MGIINAIIMASSFGLGAADDQLEVLDAWYGLEGQSCEFTYEASQECDGEDYCEFQASNRLCGDPARSRRKQMYISYSCGDGIRSLLVNERETARIFCLGANKRVRTTHRERDIPVRERCRNRFDCDDVRRRRGISINEVAYGARGRFCDATYVFEQACDGRNECSLEIDNELCGDPSRGNPKVATIDYDCDGENYRITVGEDEYARLSCFKH